MTEVAPQHREDLLDELSVSAGGGQ